MSSSRNDQKLSSEEDWAIVDVQGSIVPKTESPSLKEKTKMKNKKSKGKKTKKADRDEPEYEVIPEKEMTMSTIMATTDFPPLEKDHDNDDKDWGLVNNPQENCKILDDFFSTLPDKELEHLTSEEEFVQIPDKQHGSHEENILDSSSTSSFDVIDENKRKTFSHDEADGIQESITPANLTELRFHLDFQTMLALFFLTTALGFVIGHGIGIATSLLVVKTPSLKVPVESAEPQTSKSSAEKDIMRRQDSRLGGKIQKWKSMYKNEKTASRQYENNSQENLLGIRPGLKEAHRHLSLENFKLKRANKDIQKQLELTKVMSRHWRSQLDSLKREVSQNKSDMAEVLRKDLEYFETVYIREKRLADLWRNEEQQKIKNKVNTWKQFKERWSKKHQEEIMNKRNTSPKDPACTESDTCTKKPADKQDGFSKVPESVKADEKEEKPGFPKDHSHISAEKLFWDHLWKMKDFADEEQAAKEFDHKGEVEQLKSPLTEDTSSVGSGDKEETQGFQETSRLKGDMEKDVGKEITNKNLQETPREENRDLQETPLEKNRDRNEETKELLDGPKSVWFKREIMDNNEDLVLAYENKDTIDHKLYGFLNGDFREISSGSGDVFVTSMSKDSFNEGLGFVVSVQNDSPEPIDFFAVLPNGKVKHQQIEPEVKISIIHMSFLTGDELFTEKAERKPLVYEAIVLADGKLLAKPQEDRELETEQNFGEAIEAEQSAEETIKAEQNSEKAVEVEHNFEEAIEAEQNFEEVLAAEPLTANIPQKTGVMEMNNNDDHETTQTPEGILVERNPAEETTDVETTPIEENDDPTEAVPESYLTPGETYLFEQCSGKLYRRIVSTHVYPISEYHNVVSQEPGKGERVFYRFPKNMMFEKFVVKDVMFNENGEELTATEQDEEKLMEEATDGKPAIYEKEISSIVQQLIKNPWESGNKVPALITYDIATGTVTSIHITLWKVKRDEVISHEMLTNGKIEKKGDITEITSYHMTGYDVIRVIRQDSIDLGGPGRQDRETENTNDKDPDDGKKPASENEGISRYEHDVNHEYNSKYENSSENENRFKNVHSSKNEIVSDNEDGSELSNSRSENVDSSNKGMNDHNSETKSNDYRPDNSETTEVNKEPSGEIKDDESCSLELGKSKVTEYWTICSEQDITLTHETVERVLETQNYKEKDVEKLNMGTENSEESVSYLYCRDGTVQKTWKRVEKIPYKESTETGSKEKNEGRCGEDKPRLDNEENKKLEEHENKETEVTDSIEKNITDKDKTGTRKQEMRTWRERKQFEVDKQENEHTKQEVNEEDEGNEEYEDSEERDERDSNDEGEDEDDHDNGDAKKIDSSNAEDYKLYLKSEWHNLKMRQRQFDTSKRNNLRLQKKMKKEWQRMKEEYRKLQKYFNNEQQSKKDVATEEMWKDMKYQKQLFDNWKAQLIEEMKISLQEKWEKLKTQREEIDKKEKQLEIRKDASLRNYEQEFVEFQRRNEKGRIINRNGDVDELVSAAWEMDDVSKSKFHHDGQSEENEKMREEDPTGISNNVDEMLNVAWELRIGRGSDTHPRAMQVSKNAPEMNAGKDEMVSGVLEFSDMASEPHKTQYALREAAEMYDKVDELNSAAWELSNDKSKSQPQVKPRENTSEMNDNVDETLSADWELIKENTNNFHRHASLNTTPTKSSAKSENSVMSEKAMKEDRTLYKELPKVDESIAEPSNYQTQWDVQIKRLQNELDRLYEHKYSNRANQRNPNQLQMANQEMGLSDWSTLQNEIADSQSEAKVQPKCPMKCPITSEDPSPVELSKPEVILQPEGPPVADESSETAESQRKKSVEKEYAFADFMRGYKSLHELKAAEDSEKPLQLMNGPLPPELNTGVRSRKKNKRSTKHKTDEEINAYRMKKERHRKKPKKKAKQAAKMDQSQEKQFYSNVKKNMKNKEQRKADKLNKRVKKRKEDKKRDQQAEAGVVEGVLRYYDL